MTEQELKIQARLPELPLVALKLAFSLHYLSRFEHGQIQRIVPLSKFHKPNYFFFLSHLIGVGLLIYFAPLWLSAISLYIAYHAWISEGLDSLSMDKRLAKHKQHWAQCDLDKELIQYDEIARYLDISPLAMTHEIVHLVATYAETSPLVLGERQKIQAARHLQKLASGKWKEERPSRLLDDTVNTWCALWDAKLYSIADWLISAKTSTSYARIAGVYTPSPGGQHPLADRWLHKAQQQPRTRQQHQNQKGQGGSQNQQRQSSHQEYSHQQEWHTQEQVHHNQFEPVVNVGGTPMIQGTCVDIHGNVFGNDPLS